MKFLVVEYLSSNPLTYYKPALLMEGVSMLKLIASGLEKEGHDVSILIDNEFTNLVSGYNLIKTDETQDYLSFLEETAHGYDFDYVFPIAPDRELGDIVSRLHSSGIKTLSSDPEAINKAADKWTTYKILKKGGIPQPDTFLEAPSVDYQLIVKSRFGVGCENLHLLDNESMISLDEMIVQEYIDGVHASVTLFTDGRESKAVSLNEQFISFSGDGSEYSGGRVPLSHPLEEKAFTLAEKAVDSIEGLKGCVGVDLVLYDKAYIIEINPRVTTSMTALEEAADINIAGTAVNAFNGNMPENLIFRKNVRFNITDAGIIITDE